MTWQNIYNLNIGRLDEVTDIVNFVCALCLQFCLRNACSLWKIFKVIWHTTIVTCPNYLVPNYLIIARWQRN